MALDEYRQKRDFSKTPEPSGTPGARPAGSKGARFVVQRHRARRLHYDFRLEMAGVLASWAVPKGPSLDPAARRLAVHVEDHPLEYFDFEGVIPKGEYGGGDVIVWDWGTWWSPKDADPVQAVESGELHVVLEGEKVKGNFMLVRSGRRARGHDLEGGGPGGAKSEWILFHKRDEHAIDGWDPEAHPRSVKTGRTNDEVAAGADSLWLSGAPPERAHIDLSGATTESPDFVAPMLATLGKAPFSHPDWTFEVKWDGFRVQAVVDGGQVRLFSRTKQRADSWFPDLADPPVWIDAASAVVDGEVTALDERGHPSFSLLQTCLGRRNGTRRADEAPAVVVYQAFDLLHLDGRSVRDLPLRQRRALLERVLRPHPLVRLSSAVAADGEDLFRAAAALGLEGVVAKHAESRYEPGQRSRQWLKLKARREQEFVVCGWEPARTAPTDLGSLLLGVYDGPVLHHCGGVGSGFTAAIRAELLGRLRPIERPDPPSTGAPRSRTAHWVDPVVVVRCEFNDWTNDGNIRQASYKGIAHDRNPGDVAREDVAGEQVAGKDVARVDVAGKDVAPAGSVVRVVPSSAPKAADAEMAAAQAATPDELAELDRLPPTKAEWQLGGRTLTLTNLDKVLFPASGPSPARTKRDLIRYYAEIAPVLLPYLVDRPLNLHRYPDGVHRPGFWHKELPGYAPAWLRRWENTDADPGESRTYVVADGVASLAWLANHGAVEIHPWTSTTADAHAPTYALIDIDPGPATAFDDVRTLARLYRAALDHLGVRGLPKVTGSRGIQIWVPIVPRYTFAETRSWVEQVSRAVGATVPDLVSWEWEVHRRSGRARLDYTQNAINKTLVGPYVVRAAPGAPVSAPIAWDELDDPELAPDRWDIVSVRERLAVAGDPFAGAVRFDQTLPAL